MRKRRAPTRPTPEADTTAARHHQLKTHTGWQVTRDPHTGHTTWTSPTGRTYTVDPEPVVVHAAGPPPAEDPPPF